MIIRFDNNDEQKQKPNKNQINTDNYKLIVATTVVRNFFHIQL